MPVYKNPDTGDTQALPEQVAALYPYLEKVADESSAERDEREGRRARIEAEEAKVDISTDDSDLGRHAVNGPVDGVPVNDPASTQDGV